MATAFATLEMARKLLGFILFWVFYFCSKLYSVAVEKLLQSFSIQLQQLLAAAVPLKMLLPAQFTARNSQPFCHTANIL